MIDTYAHKDVETYEVETSAGTVASMAEHPFYVVGRGWIPVRDLRPGDQLVDPKGSDVDVVAVTATGETATVYNFNVEGLHTYHVAMGETWVRVHNKCWTKTDYNGQRVYTRDDLVNHEYVSPLDKYGRTNLKRMQQGLAPMGPDDKPVNLHHLLQTQDGPIAEVSHSTHSGNYHQLHWKSGTDTPSGIDRKAFGSWKEQCWKDRAGGFTSGGAE